MIWGDGSKEHGIARYNASSRQHNVHFKALPESAGKTSAHPSTWSHCAAVDRRCATKMDVRPRARACRAARMPFSVRESSALVASSQSKMRGACVHAIRNVTDLGREPICCLYRVVVFNVAVLPIPPRLEVHTRNDTSTLWASTNHPPTVALSYALPASYPRSPTITGGYHEKLIGTTKQSPCYLYYCWQGQGWCICLQVLLLLN